MRILRWIAISTVAILLVGAALWLSRFTLTAWFLEATTSSEGFARAPINERFEKQMKLIQEDRAQLLAIPFFRPSAGKADAAPFLNPKLSWEGDVPPEWSKPQFLDLPPELTQERAAQKDWLSWNVDWPRWKLDFSWLASLSQFDVWSVDSSSPAIDPRKQYSAADFPTPHSNGMQMLTWSEMRLLKARQDGDVDLALAQVHQLARLLWTNDTAMSAQVAIAILRSETAFAAAQTPPIARPYLIPQSTLDRASRYFWVLGEGPDPRLTDQVWNQLVQEPGLCLAVAEPAILTYAGIVRPLLADDFAAPLQRFGELVDQTAGRCRPSWIRGAWRDPTYPLLFRYRTDIFAGARITDPGHPHRAHFPVTWSDLKAHPQLRKTYGYLALRIASIDPLRQYEKGAGEVQDAGP